MWVPFLNWLVEIKAAEGSGAPRLNGPRRLGLAGHGHDVFDAGAPARRGAARGRAGDAARTVLRPRLRAGDHAVHGADVPPADLGGPRQGHARARGLVVVLGGL